MISSLLAAKTKFCIYILIISVYSTACRTSPSEQKTNIAQQKTSVADHTKIIEGENEPLSLEDVEKGNVLISYNDCYTCHKEDKPSFGPSFVDIAKRYPTNKVFIKTLAQKVIIGGSRQWGYTVMLPHPKLSSEDAELMVSYILSLKK